MRPFRSGISTYHLMMVNVQALNTVCHAVCSKLLQSAFQSKYTTQTTSPTSRYVHTSRLSVHKPEQLTSMSRALQDNEGSITPALSLKRTSTGIISNRRPTTGTPALSGTTTPSESQASGSATPGPRLSIMAAAKQQAARRMLYTMFYRGPVLTNEEKSGSEEPASVAGLSPSKSASPPPHTRKTVRSKDNKSMSKKRRAEREDEEEEEDKQERKRRKREAKEKDGKSLPKSKGKGKEMEMEMVAVVGTQASDERDDGDDEALEDSKASKAARKAEKAERKRRKAEKLARKEERRKRKLEEERRQRKLERKAAKIKGVESKTDADEGDSGSQDTTPIDRSAATGTSSASPSHTKVKKKGKKS